MNASKTKQTPRAFVVFVAAFALALCFCLAGCSSSPSTNAAANNVPETLSLANGANEKPLADEQRASLEKQSTANTTANTNAGRPASEKKSILKLDDMDDNIFLDALAYLGYNLEKHRADGMMWEYVFWTDKDWRGWLSNITYGAGSTGFETTEGGKPDVAHFEQGGLVCATYATYVYFNYLPNAAGVDVSSLAVPDYSPSSDSVYRAAKQWVEDGHSYLIDFTCSESNNWLTFDTEKEIPIGSLLFFTDSKNRSDTSSHVCVYAGYANGYHWVTHVGNENGPEFCAVERMHYGPDPQWPIAVVSRPDVVK